MQGPIPLDGRMEAASVRLVETGTARVVGARVGDGTTLFTERVKLNPDRGVAGDMYTKATALLIWGALPAVGANLPCKR